MTVLSMFCLNAFVAWASIFFMRNQIIKVLLGLEMLMLMIFMTVIISFIGMIPLGYSMFLLVLGAIEASLGLSMAVMMTRSSGSDTTELKNILSC